MTKICGCPEPEFSSPYDMKLEFNTKIVPVVNPGGGTSDYNKLSNRPSINGIVLEGNKTNEELLIDAISNEEIERLLK